MKDWMIGMYAFTLADAKRLTQDVECEDFARIEHGIVKHPAWVLGHLAAAGDLLVGMSLGGERTLSKWDPLFMPGAEPKGDRSAYPTKQELLDALEDRHEAVTAGVRTMSEGDFDAELSVEAYREFWPTVRHAVGYMMVHHEPYHLGQLTQWRKACGIATSPAF